MLFKFKIIESDLYGSIWLISLSLKLIYKSMQRYEIVNGVAEVDVAIETKADAAEDQGI